MSRQGYTYQPGPAPARQSANHGTSSAFSSSANPDEDWTQISDLAERRRIQNRIAQRNYRKKLKRRLEDLERRAGSSSESPPQSYAELKQPSPKASQPTHKPTPPSRAPKPSPRDNTLQLSQYTPPMQTDDEVFSHGFSDRDGSHTPPLFSYHHYPPPDESSLYPAYPLAQPYRALPADSYGDYLAPGPAALPSMQHFNDALGKRDDDINAFGMSFAAMAGLDIAAHQSYEDPHTPPLCHSFDHSAAGSDAGYHTYPGTPLSLPPSPRSLHL